VPATVPLKKSIQFTLQIAANSLLGFLFARYTAQVFGVSQTKDIFDIAYAVPFLVLKLSGFYILHGILLVKFQDLRSLKTDREQSVFISTILSIQLTLAIVFCGVLYLFRSQIASLLVPSYSGQAILQLESLLVLAGPLALSIGTGVFLSAVLISQGVPVSSEFTQFMSRVVGVSCLAFLGKDTAPSQLLACLTTGAVVALGCQLYLIWDRTPIRYTPVFLLKNMDVVGILGAVPGLVMAGVLPPIAFLYMQRLATIASPGDASAISYSLFLVSPLSVLLGKPIHLAINCNSNASNRHERLLSQRSRMGFRAVVAMVTLLIACCGLFYFAEEIIQMCFGGGQFGDAAVSRTAGFLRIAIWAIPPSTTSWFFLGSLLSLRRPATRAFALAIGPIVQLALSLALGSKSGTSWLLAAYVAGAWVQAIVGAVVTNRKEHNE
jgi:peptidoglycan biosynthesis protein MviN/MurJ (putative lipid II flippase)